MQLESYVSQTKIEILLKLNGQGFLALSLIEGRYIFPRFIVIHTL